MLWNVVDVPQQPTIRLVSARSGKCLNVPGRSIADNVQLVQYTCSPSVNVTNDQVYLPPANSARAVARPWTGLQPVTVLHEQYEQHYLSWVGADRQVNVIRVHDLNGPRTNPPATVYQRTIGGNYTGRTQAAFRQDGRAELVAQEAAAGDVVLTYENAVASGTFSAVQEFGGALAGQPAAQKIGGGGFGVGTFAIRDGSLWYALESELDPQAPVGAWRNLGGTDLTGTPTVVEQGYGARIFVRTTGGKLLTATFGSGGLNNWLDLGGEGLADEPAQVAGFGIDLAVFARTTEGAVVYKPFSEYDPDGFPAEWTSIGGPPATGPLSVQYDATFQLAYRGPDNVVYYRAETGYGTRVFGEPVRISDPADRGTLAAADPTIFELTSGSGIAFPSADASVEVPVVYAVEGPASVKKLDLKAPRYPAVLGS